MEASVSVKKPTPIRPMLDVINKIPAELFGEGSGKRLIKGVLLAIAASCDPDGTNAYPSVETIAERVLCSTKQAGRAIKWLEERGLITVESRAGRAGKLRGRTNRYQINFDRIHQFAETGCRAIPIKTTSRTALRSRPETEVDQAIDELLEELFPFPETRSEFLGSYGQLIGVYIIEAEQDRHLLRVLKEVKKCAPFLELEGYRYVDAETAFHIAMELVVKREPKLRIDWASYYDPNVPTRPWRCDSVNRSPPPPGKASFPYDYAVCGWVPKNADMRTSADAT